MNKPKRRRNAARRGHRRNPPISSLPKLSLAHLDIKAVGAYIVKGAQIGVLTFGGRVLTGYATALVDLIPGLGNNTAAVEIGLQFVASVVIGVAGAMVNPFVGVCLMGGGFEGAIDNFVQTYIPSVSQALQLSAGGAAAAPASGYARRRVAAYARTRGLPLNPAIPGPVQRRGMARVGAYAGNDTRSNMANENV